MANKRGKEAIEMSRVLQNSCNPPQCSQSRGGNNKKLRRRQRRTALAAPPPLVPVQRLYEACRVAFSECGPGIVPTPENVQMLRQVMDEISPADVGVNPEKSCFRPTHHRASAISYLHLYDCPNFSIGIFCLPPSGVIPLHNHPGMTVFSKLLFGKLHIKAYDWVADSPSASSASSDSSASAASSATPSPPDSDAAHHPGVRLAKLKVDAEFSAPCNPLVLYPADGGNLHCFTARTACAVLDVLGPPYSDPDGRHCQYYSASPFADFSDGITVPEEETQNHAWLQEIEKPEDVLLVGRLYKGPKIVAE